MVTFVIVSAVVGAVLGLRFNVSIFVPTILIVMAAVIFGGIATRHEPAVIALILFGTVASLELGYVAGCVVRPMLPRHALHSGRVPTLGSIAMHSWFRSGALALKTPVLPV